MGNVEMLVLDEFDTLLTSHSAAAMERIRYVLPSSRQTVLVSATMSGEAGKNAARFVNNPVEIELGAGRPPESVRHETMQVESRPDRYRLLVHLIEAGHFPEGIVFARDGTWVKEIGEALGERGHNVSFISGATGGDQSKLMSIDKILKGKSCHLVASDEAALGLDIPAVSTIVNFDTPNSFQDYLRRSGRTGRAGSSGRVISFVDSRGALKLAKFAQQGGFDLEPQSPFELPEVPLPPSFSSRL